MDDDKLNLKIILGMKVFLYVIAFEILLAVVLYLTN